MTTEYTPKAQSDWAKDVHDWAKRKGWWEPQCKHENLVVMHTYTSGANSLDISWCKDCGALGQHTFDAAGPGYSWQLPEQAKTRNQGELMMLMVSEIVEAFEETRHHHAPDEIYYGPDGKPEGVPIELADEAIRIDDYCGHHGIDLEAAKVIKMAYNEKRPYRHGGLAS